jgi:nitrite reductase (NADH) large subunit
VAGVEVASMGTTEPELDTDEVLQVVEARKQTYRKLIVREGKLVGAMLVGDTDAAASLVQFFDRSEPLPANRLEVLCDSALSGTKCADPSLRTVCQCKKVAQGTIVEAIVAGALSTEQLGEATGAGTGCGACQPVLLQLIADHSAQKKGARTLELAKAV